MKEKISVLTSIILLSVTAWSAYAAPTDIYLVRHAEKQQSAKKDPALSLCGVAQAQAMAALIISPLSVIYHSGYQRTEQTAQQIALTHQQAPLQPYNAADLPAIAAKILQQDNSLLVVGHSNTTTELIQLLSQQPGPQITEQDYGVVYHLKQSPQGYRLSDYKIKQPAECSQSSG